MEGRLIALVGPGDSTKSTILDAIALVATPRANQTFVEADFFAGGIADGFLLEATFSELPSALLAEHRFGLELGEITSTGELRDELVDGEPTMTIRLEVDDDLEGRWLAVSTLHPEGRPISARDRAAFAVARVAESSDRAFTWARGTTLSRMTADPDEISTILATAYRDARDAVRDIDLSSLALTVENVRLLADQIGAGVLVGELDVGLELSATTGSGLSLHTGPVPFARSGLGTRRLLATAIELGSAAAGAVVCLDELEHGLEPHRIWHFLKTLQTKVGDDVGGAGQVIFTTHAPSVLEVLGCDGVHVVRSDQGAVSVRQVGDELTALVRTHPSALLARRVVLCEGATELGLLLGISPTWAQRHDSRPVTHLGTTFADGGGRTKAPPRALELRALGYDVLVFADSDHPLVPNAATLVADGVSVVTWSGAVSTEMRVAGDASIDVLRRLLVEVADDISERSVCDCLLATAAGQSLLASVDGGESAVEHTVDGLVASGLSETDLRNAFAEAASNQKWLKNIRRGILLGEVLSADEAIAGTDLDLKLRDVELWCYGGD